MTTPTTDIVVATPAAKFIAKVEAGVQAELGQAVSWTPLQRTLANHLYLKINSSLKELQAKGKNIHWGNVNMAKLAVNSVHIVNLEIDGTLRNHVNVIPYKNGALSRKNGQDVYDLTLRPGYEGALHSRKRGSIDPIVDVITKLVYPEDVFRPLPKSRNNPVEHYVYEQGANIFDPGDPIGGFGYIEYEDPRKNKLIIVTMRDFARSEAASRSKGTRSTDEETGEVTVTGNFWQASRIEMMEKTVVFRTVEEIQLDPGKINATSFSYIDMARVDEAMLSIDAEIEANANRGVLEAPVAAQPETDAAETTKPAEPVKERQKPGPKPKAAQAPAEAQQEPTVAEARPELTKSEANRLEASNGGFLHYDDEHGVTRLTRTGEPVVKEAPTQASPDPKEFGRAAATKAGQPTYEDGNGDTRSTETGDLLEDAQLPLGGGDY